MCKLLAIFYTVIYCKSSVRITLWYFHIFAHESNRSAGAGYTKPDQTQPWASPRWRLHNLSGQWVPMFDHTQNKKVFFLVFELNIPCFNLSLALWMHFTKRSLTSCICTHGWGPPELSLLQTQQLFQPLCVCQMLQPLHCTSLDSLQYVCILLVLDTNARCLSRAEQRWRITYSPQLTGNAVPNAAQNAVEIGKLF